MATLIEAGDPDKHSYWFVGIASSRVGTCSFRRVVGKLLVLQRRMTPINEE